MAVTAMWPVKGRVETVINYARNPEKTTETSREFQAELHTINNVVEYAANDLKTEKRMYVTCLNCTERDAAKQFMETKRLWSQISGLDKTAGRSCYHGYQSFRKEEVTAEIAHEIGVKLAERLWGSEYEVVVATHCNTGHYHNHFVLNPVSIIDGHKFFESLADYRAMRAESDRLCQEYGLSLLEEPMGRRRNYGEFLAEKNGKPTNRSLIRDDIDRAVKASVTEQEFYRCLEQMGYELKLCADNGRPLKYPALRPPGAKGFFRFHKLGGEEYTLEEIRERIAYNYHRRVPFPEEEREAVRVFREQNRPRVKATGLRALYIRYCFELHIIEKHPASVKRVPFSMREDLIRLDKLDAQTRFLGENNIDTIEDLNRFRKTAEEKLDTLTGRRSALRNELKRVTRAADGEKIAEVKEQISSISREMKEIRRSMKLCDSIEERSRRMEDSLQNLTAEQTDNDRKGENGNEHVFERRGGTSRPYDAGRY
ncbi:MAG: relaxase/mobilization nuclease domain-containing protein [Oscillospiraceae bacterium]|nr:relaxase/mobilization nuclease domain-containing protein [Oscillospiraceae bacterium]